MIYLNQNYELYNLHFHQMFFLLSFLQQYYGFAIQYKITGEDLAKGTKFFDGIVCCDNPIDNVMRSNSSMTHEAIVDEGSYYTIPFRSLIPANVTNLMFAGRIVCADPTAFASVRGMPQCMTMGQATGIAAALTLKSKTTVQAIDIKALVRELSRQGVNGLGESALI